jgi:hypothetical protein
MEVLNMCKIKLVIILLFCFLLAGCANSTITSVVDPYWTPREFSRIMVYMLCGPLDIQIMAEDIMVEKLREYNIDAVPSYKVIPPVREYTSEEWNRVFTEHDGILLIVLTDKYIVETTLPETTTTEGYIDSWGNIRSRTRTSGGGTISSPRLMFDIKLYDLFLLEPVWSAFCRTEGTAMAKDKDIISSLANKLLEKLEEDGIIKTPVEATP